MRVCVLIDTTMVGPTFMQVCHINYMFGPLGFIKVNRERYVIVNGPGL